MINEETRKYIESPPSARRSILKEQYMARVPSLASAHEKAGFHLNKLVEFTRRLNMVECKAECKPIIKPILLRTNDLFVCVEICTECIQVDHYLQNDALFKNTWTAFTDLVAKIKAKNGSDQFFEAAYLLLYLAATIFKQHVVDGDLDKEPSIFAIQGYGSLAAQFPQPLFRGIESRQDQFNRLTENITSLLR